MLTYRLLHYPYFHHPSFTPGSKLISSTKPPHHKLFLPSHHTDFTDSVLLFGFLALNFFLKFAFIRFTNIQF